jgi:cobyrinic acid a,c-diamide synthase
MLSSIKKAVDGGLCCLAECGGFMYLHKKMEGMEGISYEMAGVIDGEVYRTPKLSRFGYIDITAKHAQLLGEEGTTFKAHEFHYFDSTACGNSFEAKKPLRKRGWECINGSDTLEAGFPHLYYYSNPKAVFAFLKKCVKGD